MYITNGVEYKTVENIFKSSNGVIFDINEEREYLKQHIDNYNNITINVNRIIKTKEIDESEIIILLGKIKSCPFKFEKAKLELQYHLWYKKSSELF